MASGRTANKKCGKREETKVGFHLQVCTVDYGMNCGHVFGISMKRQKITLAFFFPWKRLALFFVSLPVSACIHFFFFYFLKDMTVSVYSCYFPQEEKNPESSEVCQDLPVKRV